MPSDTRDLIALHLQIDEMYALRRLREGWGDLTAEGVQHYATIAHGKHRGFAMGAKRMAEIQARKVASE